MKTLLFHPLITKTSFVAGLTALATFIPDIKATFGTKGLIVAILIAVALAVCTAGRSPIKSVDNAGT